jgi:hypothetical protein
MGESSTKLSSEKIQIYNVAIALKFGTLSKPAFTAGELISIVKRKLPAYLLYAGNSITLFRPYNTPNSGLSYWGVVLPLYGMLGSFLGIVGLST